ncbi:Golgi apparatus membrane protein tvp23 [Tulasnella sp. 331]|nr:Golgi apparatus membrane protein tvp23 [Tulasnella sp. 331]KAG8870991.1 Golgi apparatus membrane protein tvp23 [Tulasnella sp. 332]
MSYQQPLQTIEPDEPAAPVRGTISTGVPQATRQPVVLTPTATSGAAPGDLESGLGGILRQSSHPLALFCLYLFRVSAIAVYILCGLFTDNYVLSTVVVVVLLAMDFWNCRNVAGRTLVGLRFWNQVDEDGESYWVFESRDPSRAPANPIDSKMFWIALYAFPVLWVLLLIVSLLKFNISFLPIVGLAIVFNVTNVIGFTYADRDSKQRWVGSVAGGSWNSGLGGLGGQILGGVVRSGVSRVFQ